MSDVKLAEIPGFAGYKAGDDGSVWSYRSPTGWGYFTDEPKRLKPWPNIDGRLVVSLCNGSGKAVQRFVHRLVLHTFIGPCPEGMEACHNDGKPLNNALSNLRWDTHKNNCKDRSRHGTENRGEAKWSAKLTESKVSKIRKLHATGKYTLREIGKRFGVSTPNVCMIVNRVTWRHVS